MTARPELGGKQISSRKAAAASAAEDSLASFRLGEKLRRLRLKKKISLVDLGRQTGLSPSMLSQLENGKLIPTLPTLSRIAAAFELTVGSFFSAPDQPKPVLIVRAKERVRHRKPAGTGDPAEFLEPLPPLNSDKSAEAFIAHFLPGAGYSNAHFHAGFEFLFLISGRLELRTPAGTQLLEPGDCCQFDSSEAHSYRAASGENAVAFMITSPPRTEF